jgi:hypothetical protein
MTANAAHLRTINLLTLIALLAAVLLGGCDGGFSLDLNLDEGGDSGGSGTTTLDNNVIVIILVLVLAVVILAVARR